TYTETIPATGHDEGEWEVLSEPGCTKKGRRALKCTKCGEILEEEDTDAAGHKPGDWEVTIEPTIFSPGAEIKTCTVCGELLETREIPADTTTFYIIGGSALIVLVAALAILLILLANRKRRRKALKASSNPDRMPEKGPSRAGEGAQRTWADDAHAGPEAEDIDIRDTVRETDDAYIRDTVKEIDEELSEDPYATERPEDVTDRPTES
ncbi:MAG: hypothetical protein J5842_03570, partial [Lachnospiraceae bacterium]|nr:hypothetical protein [Lachnospiraceae bacterium]